jgi:fructuronate reductase
LLLDNLVVPLAGWMRFIAQRARSGAKITDPLAERLTSIGTACSGDAPADVARFLALDAVFPRDLAEDSSVRNALERAYARLDRPLG